MRIGFDGKWFFDGPPSNRRVTRNFIFAFSRLSLDEIIYVFLDKKHKHDIFPFASKNIVPVYVWAGINLLSNTLLLPIYCRALHLDAIISQNFSPLWSAAKRVTYIHDTIFASHPHYFSIPERLYFLPMKTLARKSDTICTISNSEKNRMTKLGFTTRGTDIEVVYHGIESNFKPLEDQSELRVQEVRTKYGLPSNFLLYVGRLNQRKNLDNLLRAYALIRNSTLPMILVGRPDWKMFDIERLVQELQLADSVRILGNVGDSDLPIIYALARVFCFVSVEEGFGLPPLEAMACGTPVVVSNSSSLPEVCGEFALYVDPLSPEDIARVVERLINDMTLYARLREGGIKHAREFTWDRAAEKLMQVARSSVAYL